MRLPRLLLCSASVIALAAATATPARADNVAWTDWTSVTAGSPGTGTGSISTVKYGTIGVTYSGQTSGILTDYPSWGPSTTFTGGVVGNSPPAANNAIGMEGGVTYTETITFSQTIADPILAIWSLGAPGTPAYFDFNSSEPFNVIGSGGSNEYGGGPIVQQGNNIYGEEGDGIVQFIGDYSSITFTTPNYEDYYAFTTGEDDTLTTQIGSTAPEPSSLLLLATGLLGAVGTARRRLLPS